MKTTITDTKQKVVEGQKKWGRGIDIDPKNINIKDIDDFMQFKTLEYKVYNFKDNELQEAYKDNFQNFTLQIFKNCNQIYIRKLQILLRTNGVWVRKYRNAIVPKLLFNTLQEEKPIEQTKPEIKKYIIAKKKFNLERIDYLFKNDFASTSTSTSTTENPTL